MAESTRVSRPVAPGIGATGSEGGNPNRKAVRGAVTGISSCDLGSKPGDLVVRETEGGLEHVQDPQLGGGRLARRLRDADREAERPHPLRMGGEAVRENP